MRIDAHTRLGQNGVGQLLAMLDENGCDQAVVSLMVDDLAASPRMVEQANRRLAEAVGTSTRLIAFGSINPRFGDGAVSQLATFKEQGLHGIMLHPPAQGFSISDRQVVGPMCREAARFGLPVMFSAGLQLPGMPYVYQSLYEFADVAREHPDTTFILGHMAFGSRDAMGIDILATDCPRVLFDTSGVSSPEVITHVVRTAGAERVLYGSGFPYLEPRVEALKIEMAGLDDSQLGLIWGGNARRLLAGGGGLDEI